MTITGMFMSYSFQTTDLDFPKQYNFGYAIADLPGSFGLVPFLILGWSYYNWTLLCQIIFPIMVFYSKVSGFEIDCLLVHFLNLVFNNNNWP